LRIHANDLPGRNCAPDDAPMSYENVHVGLQRGREPYDLVPGDAANATWEVEVTTKRGRDGGIDVGGPFAQGKAGERFFYLTWGTIDDDGTFNMFRRAKLMLSDIDADVLACAAAGEGALTAHLGLSDGRGLPVCARVRPHQVSWTCE
jgi:Family of unknown function (DUF5990)